MAQPYPPQGGQQQYNERPLKVYGEQFTTGGPLPVGVLTTAPTGEPTPPYLISASGLYQPVHDTDWILSNRYTGRPIEVVSDEEFTERFGGGGNLAQGG
jgi:hypothetical protein